MKKHANEIVLILIVITCCVIALKSAGQLKYCPQHYQIALIPTVLILRTIHITVILIFFAEDIDNDDSTELVLSMQGSGCGATANFIILWDENGNGYVDHWWIETSENTYAESIPYTDN